MQKLKTIKEQATRWGHVVGYGVCVVVIMWQTFSGIIMARLPQAEAVVYRCSSIECQLEDMAREIYKEREAVNLERARLEAVEIMGERLIQSTETSPFVNYDHVREVVHSAGE